LHGIKIHFREFLYDFALKRNKLLAERGTPNRLPARFVRQDKKAYTAGTLGEVKPATERPPRMAGALYYFLITG
jgi:hypothetical protein